MDVQRRIDAQICAYVAPKLCKCHALEASPCWFAEVRNILYPKAAMAMLMTGLIMLKNNKADKPW